MIADALRVRGVHKHYGGVPVLDRIDLDVAAGEFLTLLGPSGCGKSTLLRLIAGFEAPDGGEIELAGKPMRGVPTYDRPLTMMFQSLALFPNMNVGGNVGYGLRVRGAGREERSRKVTEALELVGLTGMADRSVTALSGGQRQRVSLARCLVIRPALLLLDEPLAALDLQLRRQLQTELKDVQRRTGCAFIFVTHDQEEAMTMSDRIAVMRAGRIEQVGSPSSIYSRPRNSFVATFIGEVNLLHGRDFGQPTGSATGGRIAVRPESFVVGTGAVPASADAWAISGTLSSITQISSVLRYRVETAAGTLTAVRLAGMGAEVHEGQPVTLTCRAADAVPIAD